jgi:hypothetical protein
MTTATLYAIEIQHPTMGWTDDPTLLGNGCNANDNRWPSEVEALAACDELARDLEIHRDALRVVPIDPENYSEEPSVPTVLEILDSTAIGCGRHAFAVEGGTLRTSTETLRAVLEAHYDPGMANWVALIGVSDFRA